MPVLFRRDATQSLPQRVEVRSSGLARQSEGLGCTEQAALTLRFLLPRSAWEVVEIRD